MISFLKIFIIKRIIQPMLNIKFSESWTGDILLNILASLIFAVISLMIGGIIYWFFIINQIGKKYNFFGIEKEIPKITIYLSSLPFNETKLRDAYGNEALEDIFVVDVREFELLPLILRINYETPKFLLWLFRSKDLNIQFKCLPIDVKNINEDGFADHSTLCIGSSHFNKATKHYMSIAKPPVIFSYDTSGKMQIQVDPKKLTYNTSKKIIPIEPEEDIAIIERFHVENFSDSKSKTIIIAAGTSINGTIYTARYLIKNWHILFNLYGKEDFMIMFRGKNHKASPPPYGARHFNVLDFSKNHKLKYFLWRRSNEEIEKLLK